jgi:hypothetical protein
MGSCYAPTSSCSLFSDGGFGKRLDCPLNQQLLPSPAHVREYSEQVHAMDDACQYSIRVVRTLHLGGPRCVQRLITLGGSCLLPAGYRISTLMFFRAIHCA